MAQSPDRTHRAETTAPGRTMSRWLSATMSRGWHSSTSPMAVDAVTLTNLVSGSMPR